MALGMMVPAMASGWLQGAVGLPELLPLGHGCDDPGVHRNRFGENRSGIWKEKRVTL